MMEIWGGLEAFKDIEAETIAEREGDAKLLNGPKIDGEDAATPRRTTSTRCSR